MVKTFTTFFLKDSKLISELVNAKIEEHITLGNTTGFKEIKNDEPEAGQYTNERLWVNRESAQAWIDFINTIEIPPIAARIED